MNRPRSNRYRAAGVLSLAVAMGLLAAVGALAGIAVANDGGHHSEKRHGHHHRHHQPSGTIQSFDPDTGRLTIALLNDETVSGFVTHRTKIKCEDEHAPDVTASRRHLRHGEPEPGDDHGGPGRGESGDDHGGGDNSGPGHSNSTNRGPSGHDDNGHGANCTTSDLIVGAVVTEAELEIEHDGLVFKEVDLAD